MLLPAKPLFWSHQKLDNEFVSNATQRRGVLKTLLEFSDAFVCFFP
jgi:hypothetical protein